MDLVHKMNSNNPYGVRVLNERRPGELVGQVGRTPFRVQALGPDAFNVEVAGRHTVHVTECGDSLILTGPEGETFHMVPVESSRPRLQLEVLGPDDQAQPVRSFAFGKPGAAAADGVPATEREFRNLPAVVRSAGAAAGLVADLDQAGVVWR